MSNSEQGKVISIEHVLILSLKRTFFGFTRKHLGSILGTQPLSGLKAVSVEGLRNKDDININIYFHDNIDNPLAVIQGIYQPESSLGSFANLTITAYQTKESNEKWGFRVSWSSYDGQPVENLRLFSIQVLPKKGEYFISTRRQGTQEEEPSTTIGAWGGGEECMHVIKFISLDGGKTIKAIAPDGTELPIDVELVDDVYEIKARADKKVFLSSFFLTLPAHLRIKPTIFASTVKTISE